jgi:hypothetical protein
MLLSPLPRLEVYLPAESSSRWEDDHVDPTMGARVRAEIEDGNLRGALEVLHELDRTQLIAPLRNEISQQTSRLTLIERDGRRGIDSPERIDWRRLQLVSDLLDLLDDIERRAAAPRVPRLSQSADLGAGARIDLFISHASEDKPTVARPLADAIEQGGFSVWIDQAEITLGDSLTNEIDRGLTRCRYGAVILSPSFLTKRWTMRELRALTSIEDAIGQKRVLPVLHDLDHRDIVEQLPTLADRLSVSTSLGLPEVAKRIVAVLTEPG